MPSPKTVLITQGFGEIKRETVIKEPGTQWALNKCWPLGFYVNIMLRKVPASPLILVTKHNVP